MFEAGQSGIERALLDDERAAGDLLDAQQHAIPVLRSERDRFQYQQIERAGQEFSLWRNDASPMLLRRER